jgi:Barstar (barnase inhibitor)
MNTDALYQTIPPWIFLHLVTAEEAKWLPDFLYKKEGHSPVIRVLRGDKMKTRQGLMDEFGAALQFFEDFGENWYALKECLCYLDEWLPADAYILVVSNCTELLSQEDTDELHWFLQTVREVGDWWGRPITDNDRFNRGPIPFHVVLRCREGDAAKARARFKDIPFL